MPNPKIRKLDPQEVSWMKWNFANSHSINDWADELGVSHSTIKQIKRGDSYKDIPPQIPAEFIAEVIKDYPLEEILSELLSSYSPDEVHEKLEIAMAGNTAPSSGED